MEILILKTYSVLIFTLFTLNTVYGHWTFGNYDWNSSTFEDKAQNQFGPLVDYLGIPPVPGSESVKAELLPGEVIPVIKGPEASEIQLQNCQCTPNNLCVDPPTDGAGIFDPRIVNRPACPTGESYCCSNVVPKPIPICGISQTIAVPGSTPTNGQSKFGDNPWVAIIFGSDGTYFGGGTLIDSLNVITAAHKIFNRNPSKVRLGEWNLSSTAEPFPYIEVGIQEIVRHESFNSGNLQNDIAIIKLANPVDLSAYPHIKAACLPGSDQSASYVGQRCRVAGFGSNAFGTGTYQTVMKEVDVPIVQSDTCEQRLRSTRLGGGFILDKTSFLCAGGEWGKDACTGDGGSPVVCKSASGQWTAVGLVAWGVGCAEENIPGVYVNVANYRNWIDLNKKK